MLIFQKMLTLFFLMAIGCFMRLRGWISDENAGLLSKIVVNIANPALIIAAGMDSETSISNRTLMATFGMALIFYAVMTVGAMLVVRLMRIPMNMRGTYQCMFIFGNIGFMGIPLITSVYGSEYALLEALYNFVFLILLYTYGVLLFQKEARIITAGQPQGNRPKPSIQTDAAAQAADSRLPDRTSGPVGGSAGAAQEDHGQWKKMINAGTVACVIAMVLFLSKLRVPEFVSSTFDMLSNLCAPLSMFSIGASLGTMKPKELIADRRLNLFILLRLFLVPAAAIALLRCFTSDALLVRTFYVMVSVPFASVCALMAEEHRGQQALAARGVALSTVISVISLPVVGMLFGL